jgi:SseB protein N-terminal domain
LERLLGKLSGSDALVRASRGSDRRAFADVFIRSSVLFLHLPPGLEGGLDPNVTQDQLLAHIKKSAKDLSGREQFVPLCDTHEGRKRMLLFTQQAFAQEYAQARVRETKRIMPFEVLTVEGRVLAPTFRNADSVALNPGSKSEYELSAEDIAALLSAGVSG